jgi:hypothetical protein
MTVRLPLLKPEQVLHVGDNSVEDYAGACKVGDDAHSLYPLPSNEAKNEMVLLLFTDWLPSPTAGSPAAKYSSIIPSEEKQPPRRSEQLGRSYTLSSSLPRAQ